uniref:Uncharacterized protein n=1 Tax=Timema poppense TaxID=170557 RepID=A0A7R9HF25_TIMPO|nr:unnamed protein product [Timema poppensis]
MSTEPSGGECHVLQPPHRDVHGTEGQVQKCWEKHKSQARKRKLLERRQALSTGEAQTSVGKPCHSSEEIFHESSTHFVEIETKVKLGQMQELHNLKLKQEAELHEIKVEIEKTRLREAQLAVEIKEIQLARLNTDEHCGSY